MDGAANKNNTIIKPNILIDNMDNACTEFKGYFCQSVWTCICVHIGFCTYTILQHGNMAPMAEGLHDPKSE